MGHVSHRGQVRERNEDDYCILLPPAVAEGIDALLAVADGMGGHQAGEVASGYVVETLADLFSSAAYRQWVDYSPRHGDYYVAVLKEVLERLNEGLYALASTQARLRGMGTTATVALLSGRWLFIGHVGDSRAYLLRDGEMRQLTQDHSWVEEQVQSGTLAPEEAKSHPHKNILTRSLGNNLLVRVDRFSHPVQRGDVLLLCSDGLSNVVSEEEMAQVVEAHEDPQRACDRLVALANQRGGLDNITVLIARLTDQVGECTLPGGRVLGHGHGVDQAAITQKIMLRQAGARNRWSRLKGPVITALVIASLIMGAGMMAIAVAHFHRLVLFVRTMPLMLARSIAVALSMVCGTALLLIGIKILRR